MRKRAIITVLLSLAIFLMMTMAAEATTGAKTINVDYRDVILYVNGKVLSVQANEEPFIYEGRTFIPIRIVSEALNQNVEWIDYINAVKLTDKNAAATDSSLAQKEKEIQDLKLQIANLQSTIASLEAEKDEEDNDEDGVINDLEDDLVSDYEDLEDVDIEDITLDGDEDEVDVTVEVNLEDYEDEWEDLSDNDIKDWIADVAKSIQDELSEDTVVNGEIIDTDSDDVLVDFDKDGEDDLDVDFYDEDYRGGSSDSDADDVEDSLEGDSFHVDDIEFTASIYYNDDDSVTATFQAVDDDVSSEWKDLSDSTIESEVTDICEEIAAAFKDDADISLDTVTASFYDGNGDYLGSFDYDVNDETLD